MSSNKTEIGIEEPVTSSNPLDAVPDEMPFDVPYGLPISLDRAQAIIQAAVAEAKKRNWKMNAAVVDSGGIPPIEQGVIIGAIGCSGGTDSQDEIVSKAARL